VRTLADATSVTCPECGGEMEPLLLTRYREMSVLEASPTPRELRARVLENLKSVEL
jgi:PHP family Zn ribbon phosphoesterase